MTEKGQKKMLSDLLSEFTTPVRKAGKKCRFSHQLQSSFSVPCYLVIYPICICMGLILCTSLESHKSFIAKLTKQSS